MRDKAEATETIRVALVGLRRLFQRKELASMWAAASGRPSELDYTEMRLLDAVRSATDPEAHGATVGDIATRLGIDPSRASRMVASAVERGVLQRRAAQSDGRKVILEVTARGAKLQARGSDLTRARIALAIESWSRADREEFARLFARFASGMVESRET
jgi:DNA-binding MarR family transcriptional regulator